MIRVSQYPEMLQFPCLGRDCNIFHFVTTRNGGVGRENYASFNVSPYCGDEADAVTDNLQRLCAVAKIEPSHVLLPYQVHEDRIAVVDDALLSMSMEDRRNALSGFDAIVTNVPGVAVAVSTADCVPVLLYDPEQKVVAAVHAGWRGTVKRICSKVIALMQQKYGCNPANVQAAIGPSIGFDAFEVGDEVVEAFASAAYDLDALVGRNAKTDKAHIDLWEANKSDLLSAGVCEEQIEVAAVCTYTHHDVFFSARRLGIKSGRIVSGIVIR